MHKIIDIQSITGSAAAAACRSITVDNPEYFGIPEYNEMYFRGVMTRQCFTAKVDNLSVGLIAIDFPYPNNCNIYWLGVLKKFQSQGIGKKLISAACNVANKSNAKTMTVETLSPCENDEGYLKTYNFYKSNGFIPLFDLKSYSSDYEMVYMLKQII